MKRKVATIAVRSIGTLAGLLGVWGLYTATFTDRSLVGVTFPWMGAFLAVSLIINVWLVWIGYLVWFRFSPRAVRQVCGLLGVLLLLLILFLGAFRLSDPAMAAWYLLGMLGAFAFVLWGYRALSRYLNDVIFVGPRAPLNLPPLPKR